MIDVNKLIEARNALTEGLQPVLEQLKDTSIPLGERWEAYTALVENNILVNNESYSDGFLHELGGDLTQYDDFNNDRGVTVKYTDMYEHIMEADGDWQANLVAFRETPNFLRWQEKVLAEGYSSFTYDW